MDKLETTIEKEILKNLHKSRLKLPIRVDDKDIQLNREKMLNKAIRLKQRTNSISNKPKLQVELKPKRTMEISALLKNNRDVSRQAYRNTDFGAEAVQKHKRWLELSGNDSGMFNTTNSNNQLSKTINIEIKKKRINGKGQNRDKKDKRNKVIGFNLPKTSLFGDSVISHEPNDTSLLVQQKSKNQFLKSHKLKRNSFLNQQTEKKCKSDKLFVKLNKNLDVSNITVKKRDLSRRVM